MSAHPLSVVHAVASLRADHGGPSRSVSALCDGLARGGVDVQLVTAARSAGEGEALLPSAAVQTRQAQPGRRWMSAGPRDFAAKLTAALERADVLHDHGLWLATNHATARTATRSGKPRVVSPRGMLAPWALHHGRWKKGLAWVAYQRHDLATADALHATSESEVDEIRRAGFRQPVAMIPNGITMPPPRPPRRDTSEPRRALFLSRLHPKKGVFDLVDAWAALRPLGWQLVIAGPDELDQRTMLERRIEELAISPVVTVTGPVDEVRKWDIYAAADLFVLPTYSENYGLVIAEALAAGLPVITTRAAPWPALEARGGGWWIEPGAQSLTATLAAATALGRAELQAMGRQGRALVEEQPSWDEIAEQIAQLYSWLLGRRSAPAQVLVA